jgi:hypothetical protein
MGPMKSKPHFIKGFDIGRMVTTLAMLDVIRFLIFLAIITSLIISMKVLVENGPSILGIQNLLVGNFY